MTAYHKLLIALVATSVLSGPVWAERASNAAATSESVQVRSPLNVDRLLVIEDIKQLRVLYGHYLDTNNMDAIVTLFAPDAVVDAGLGVWHGRDEIRAGLAKAFADYDKQGHGSYPFLHAMANQWIEITGPDSAQGRTYLLDWATERDPKESPLLILASYADEYARVDGKWYINRSRLDIVLPARNIGGGLPSGSMVLPK